MGGKTGRAAIPTAEKIANGNPGKRPGDVDFSREAEPELKVPDMPEYISNDPEAKKEWEKVTALLVVNRLVTVIDGQALGVYCKAWSRMIKAEKQLETETYTIKTVSSVVKNPLITIINSEVEVILKCLLQFGMTPGARTKVKVSKGDENDDEKKAKWKKFAEERRIEREKNSKAAEAESGKQDKGAA